MGKVYTVPFSDKNGAKILLDGATHTYIAYIREYPPGLGYVVGPIVHFPILLMPRDLIFIILMIYFI